MKALSIKRILKAEVLAARQHLAAYVTSSNQQHIHGLRIAIKKLRALFSFMNKVQGKASFPKKVLEPLFQAAGVLRELHLLAQLKKTYTVPNGLQRELEKEEKELSVRLISGAGRYKRHLKVLEKKLELPQHLPGKEALSTYFKKEVKKSNALFKKSADKHELHRFRTRIKKMMYVYGALGKKQQKKVGLNAAYMEQLQLVVGKWHDTEKALAYFQNKGFKATELIEALTIKERAEYKALQKEYPEFKKRLLT